MLRALSAVAMALAVAAPAAAQRPLVEYSPPIGMTKVLDEGAAQRYEAANYRMLVGSVPADPACGSFAATWAQTAGGRVRLTNTDRHQLGPRADSEIVGGRYVSTIVTVPRVYQPSRSASGSTAVTTGDAARALSTMRSTICSAYGC